jgi:hypothetical protein
MKASFWAAATLVAGASTSAFAVPITVSAVGNYAPNPNALTITDAASNAQANGVTLGDFRTLISNAFTANTGGVWTGDAANGVTYTITYADGAANPISATYGASQANTFSFYRSDGANGLNTNNNNGTNVVSGDGYIGIPAQPSPVNLVFNQGLSAVGLTLVPRGAARTVTLTATLDDASTIVSSAETNNTNAVFYGFTAPAGRKIVGLGLTEAAAGFARFDDLGFVVAPVPEPVALGALTLGGLALATRRRRA